jgi:5-methylcytosine-specific restriction endonuclease McrA
MNYNNYHPDWKDIIRPQILKRDAYKCQKCQIGHKIKVYKNSLNNYVECDEFIEQWALSNNRKVFTLYLQISHIDHNTQNNSPDNLITLCPKCHSKNDSEYKKISRIMYKADIKNKPLAKEIDPLDSYFYKSDYKISLSNTQFQELEDKIKKANLLSRHQDNTRYLVCEIIRHINTYI